MSENFGRQEVEVSHGVEKDSEGDAIKMSFTVDLGASLEELRERHGDECVYTNAVVGMKTAARNRLYALTHGKDAKSSEEALALMANWEPSAVGARVTRDPVEAFLAKFASLGEDEQASLIERIRQAAQK